MKNTTRGKIRWFDYIKGEGLIRLETKESIYFHFSQMYTPSDRNFHFPSKYMQARLEKLFPKNTPILLKSDGSILLDLDRI